MKATQTARNRRRQRKVLHSEVIIVGAGFAGISAAIYLARANRETLVVHTGKSMARWEPNIQNYLGFPQGISGNELLRRAHDQAARFGAKFQKDEVCSIRARKTHFVLQGRRSYRCRRLLLATGIFHIPPDLPGVQPCLGHSLFFCKDCDGYRVRNKDIAIYGWTNEAAEYALQMLCYSCQVFIVTDGRKPRWSARNRRALREYGIPVYTLPIKNLLRHNSQIESLVLKDTSRLEAQAVFTTRGDLYLNKLARELGAKVDSHGEIVVNSDMMTSVPGVFAAGCVTPANCQMIIAAGQGATAAQAINRELFEEELATHSLSCKLECRKLV